MGGTGSGKSTFINVATGMDQAAVGHTLESCTREVQTIACSHPDGSGRRVVFVDTPGFDNTDSSTAEVLRTVADWLTKTYREHIYLSGLVYLQPISQNRIYGSQLLDLKLLERICGKAALRNLIIVTTMWDIVTLAAGAECEQGLSTAHFKHLLAAGSRMERFDGTHESAWKVLRKFKSSGNIRPVLLQTEMVDQGKALGQTSAGSVLFHALQMMLSRLRDLIYRLETSLRRPKKSNREENSLAGVESMFKEMDDLNEQSRVFGDLPQGPPHLSHVVKVLAEQQRVQQLSTVSLTSLTTASSQDSTTLPQFSRLERPEKRNESLNDINEAFEAIVSTLRMAKGVAAGAELTSLRTAIDLLTAMVQSLIGVRVDPQVTSLLDGISSFVTLIAQQVGSSSKGPESLIPFVDSIAGELNKVQAVVANTQGRGTGKAKLFLQAKDKILITECQNRTAIAFSRFNAMLQAEANSPLFRLEHLLVDFLLSAPLNQAQLTSSPHSE